MMCRIQAVCLVAILALECATPASAHDIPQPGPAPVVSLPARDEVDLANGLKATLVPYGHVPKTTIVISVGTGSMADGMHPGLAHLTAELMKQGVRGHDASSLYRHAAKLGGAVSLSAGIDTISVSIDVLAEHAPEALLLLSDVLRHPTLPESELGRLKTDLKRELAVSRSQQQGVASDAFAARLYGNGPRGRRLQESDVDAIAYSDVRQFAAKELTAGRSHIYIAGKYDRTAVKRAIHAAFDGWAAGAPALIDRSQPSSVGSVTLIDRPGAKQSTLLIGLPVPTLKSPGYTDLSMANAVLGGSGLLSRLDQNLREEKGWTYGVSTQIEPLHDAGLWVLFADVNTPDTAAALREIFKEIARLAASAPDPQELKRVQNYRAGHFLMGAASREGLISQVAFVDRYDLGADWLPGYLQRLQSVTPDGIRTAAQLFDPSRMTVVVAGDLSTIKYELQGVEALKGADFH